MALTIGVSGTIALRAEVQSFNPGITRELCRHSSAQKHHPRGLFA
jgi:hypothetical protein